MEIEIDINDDVDEDDLSELVEVAEECDEEWRDKRKNRAKREDKNFESNPSDFFTLNFERPVALKSEFCFCNENLKYLTSLEQLDNCCCNLSFSRKYYSKVSKPASQDMEDMSCGTIIDWQTARKLPGEILGNGQMIFKLRGDLKSLIKEDVRVQMSEVEALKPEQPLSTQFNSFLFDRPMRVKIRKVSRVTINHTPQSSGHRSNTGSEKSISQIGMKPVRCFVTINKVLGGSWGSGRLVTRSLVTVNSVCLSPGEPDVTLVSVDYSSDGDQWVASRKKQEEDENVI